MGQVVSLCTLIRHNLKHLLVSDKSMAFMEKKGRISTTVIMRVLRVDCVSNNPAYKPTKYAL